MLYPDLNELIALQSVAHDVALLKKRKVAERTIGESHSLFKGRGLEFEEVREYAIGDDIRSIDWRVTARLGSPHVKLFKQESERSVVIMVDTNATMQFGTKGTFKSVQAAKMAALIGWHEIAKNDKVGACLFGQVEEGFLYLKPRRSRTSLYAMMQTLCKKNPPDHYYSLIKALQQLIHLMPTGGMVYIISDFMKIDDSLVKYVMQLKKRCEVLLVAVNDVADKTLPEVEQCIFSNGQTQAIISTQQKAGQEAYQQQWQHRQHLLHQISSKTMTQLIEVDTQDNITSVT